MDGRRVYDDRDEFRKLLESVFKGYHQVPRVLLGRDDGCPFRGGVKSSLLAGKGCGRRYLGIEREEKYVKIALGRLSDEHDRQAISRTNRQQK